MNKISDILANVFLFIMGLYILYEIGSYRFINDDDLIAKGVITVLCNLRNALFHGQIIPDRETQKVYEPAYHILSTLVEEFS